LPIAKEKSICTINIFPHNDDLKKIPEYIKEVAGIGVDAIILSDPGILSIVKEIAPDMEIHLSTQANNTNFMSARFWHNHGVKRIILARELSLEEIREIREKTPDSLELEVLSTVPCAYPIPEGVFSAITWPAGIPTGTVRTSMQVEILLDGGKKTR